MADIKIPAKYTPAEARAFLKAKLASNTEGLSAERRIKEQYQSLAKGGDVKKQTKKQVVKIAKVMGEFKEGTLHSGKGGPVVKNPKQAIAISLSEAGVKLKKAKK